MYAIWLETTVYFITSFENFIFRNKTLFRLITYTGSTNVFSFILLLRQLFRRCLKCIVIDVKLFSQVSLKHLVLKNDFFLNRKHFININLDFFEIQFSNL